MITAAEHFSRLDALLFTAVGPNDLDFHSRALLLPFSPVTGCVLWYGEVDHVCAMVMKSGERALPGAFARLKALLDAVEAAGDAEKLKFATNDEYGFVTSCPSNLGTGMRASVRLQLSPSQRRQSQTGRRAAAEALGLSVRDVAGGGGAGGGGAEVDIAPTARLFVKEAEIVASLHKGAMLLLHGVDEEAAAEEEKEAAANEEQVVEEKAR